jgi:hydroxymethylbilane synthase
VGTGGDFRNHPAERGMLADLREDDVGQNAAVTFRISFHHGGGGFVASRFDAENDHRCIIWFAAVAKHAAWRGGDGLSLEGAVTQSSTDKPILRIGSRGSPLALVQAREVQNRIAAAAGIDAAQIEIKVIRTTGDIVVDRPLADAGGKGLFTKEIEEALLAGSIDLAVHSSKDLPTVLPAGLVLAGFPPREDPRDAFISHKAATLRELPPGAVVGTSSPRRHALVKKLRPDATVVTLRGNVETRLRKLEAGEVDATLLAVAGLKRLGLLSAATAILDPDYFLPAVGQGAIGIETRADDAKTRAFVEAINDADTSAALAAERAFLAVLDGSCRTPIGGHATLDGGTLRFRGIIVKPDGSEAFEVWREGSRETAVELGADAGRELRDRASADFFVRA